MTTKMDMLVVEDNFHARQALSAYLSHQEGLKVSSEASNGLEAIERIRGHVPDIVLMDMQMPIMDGLEATRIIKKSWPRIKIIVLTLYPDYQSEALSAGADAFLVKGGCAAEILSTIHKLIGLDEVGEVHPKA